MLPHYGFVTTSGSALLRPARATCMLSPLPSPTHILSFPACICFLLNRALVLQARSTPGSPPMGWARGAPRAYAMDGATTRRTSPTHGRSRIRYPFRGGPTPRAPPMGWAPGAPHAQPMGGSTMRRTSQNHERLESRSFVSLALRSSGAAHGLDTRRAACPTRGRIDDEMK